jgi:ubiquinone/menaquinone biosynthesis C-methylase UbiE
MLSSDAPLKMLDYTTDGTRARALERVRALPARLNVSRDALKGSKVLDLGCGQGETANAMVEEYGAEVTAVDPYDRCSGGPFFGKFTFFEYGVEDLPASYDNYFDFAQSYTVLEHIPDPVKALEKLYRVLKPGARAFLVINLFRGASASHSNQDVGDWCHLLMEWREIEETCKAKGKRAPAPVNKLTFLEYYHHINRIGFDWVKPAWFQRREMTQAFYDANRDVFQWFPRDELNRDFLLVSISKSGRPTLTENDYLWRAGKVTFTPTVEN